MNYMNPALLRGPELSIRLHQRCAAVLLMPLSEYSPPAVTKMGEAEPPAACCDSESCGNESELLSLSKDGSLRKCTPLEKCPRVVECTHKRQKWERSSSSFPRLFDLNVAEKEHQSSEDVM